MINWLMDRPGCVLAAFAVVSAAILGLCSYWSYLDSKQWNAFSAAHHCVVIRQERGGSATTILTNGKVGFTALPAKTTYKCDDGVEYSR